MPRLLRVGLKLTHPRGTRRRLEKAQAVVQSTPTRAALLTWSGLSKVESRLILLRLDRNLFNESFKLPLTSMFLISGVCALKR